MNFIFTFALIIYVAENCVFCQTNKNANNLQNATKGDLLFVQLVNQKSNFCCLNFSFCITDRFFFITK